MSKPIIKPKPAGKLGAEKLTPEEQRPRPAGKKGEPLTPSEQRRRFEELSRELGTDNGETLDRVFGKIVPPKKRAERSEG